MKLAKIVLPIIDLSDCPSVSIVTKLKKDDLIVYEGEEWSVEIPPKKVKKGVWWIGLSKRRQKKYVKIVEDVRPNMTAHEKKTMINNIKKVVPMFGEERLTKLAIDYYDNMYRHNNYDESDVRECMSYFPINVLKNSGVVL